MSERLSPIQPRTPSVAVDTSRDAAEAIREHASNIEERVYQYIVSCGQYGATEKDICQALGISGDTCRPRVWSLMRNERVIDSGARRKTASGRQARVVVAA